MASKSRVLYTGVTNNLQRRVWEHKQLVTRKKDRADRIDKSTWEDLSEHWGEKIELLNPEIMPHTTGKQVPRCAQDDKFGEASQVLQKRMNYQTLQLAFDGAIATITLNRPDKRNAISFQLVEELLAVLDEIEKSPANVLILTGSGKAFCAGMDLEELKSLLGKTHDENVKDSARMAHLFRRLYEFPKPTIAAVNGAAIAGGTGLATMCDFTLAVPEAKFGYTEVRIGFVPAIVSSLLVWQVGHKIARDLLLSGRLFDAPEAHRLGLVNEVVAPEQLLARAQELGQQILENSPSSIRATKKLINSFIANSLNQQIAEAIEDNARIRTTADFREGVSSFLEKRKPRWSSQ